MKIFQKIVAIVLLFVEVNFSIPRIIFLSATANPKTTFGDDQPQDHNADRPAGKQSLKSPVDRLPPEPGPQSTPAPKPAGAQALEPIPTPLPSPDPEAVGTDESDDSVNGIHQSPPATPAPTPLPTPPVTTQKFLPVPTPTPFVSAPVPNLVPPRKVQRKSPGPGINPSSAYKNPLATSAQISALTSLQLFSEPLYPTAAPRVSDNNALIPALQAYANNPSPDNTEALENFVDANPKNPWTLSVETNLGLLYAKGCYWTKALAMLDLVWNQGKNQSGYKNSIDMALSKLAFVAIRLGRVQYMERLQTSVGGRILTPNAQDTYQRAKQSLDREVNHSEQGFLCGPQAVQSILTAINPSVAFTPAVGDVQSTQQGTSLTGVANLAKAVGLKMTPVEWTSDTVQIPTPAVIHWKSGHYAALVGRTEDGGYHLIDRSMELNATVSGPAIQKEGSGYFLIPTASVTSDFTPLTQGQTDNIWGKGAIPVVTPQMWQPIAGLVPRYRQEWFQRSSSLLTVRRMPDQFSLIIRTLQHTGHPHPVLSSPTSRIPFGSFIGKFAAKTS